MTSSTEGETYPSWIDADFFQTVVKNEEPLGNYIVDLISVEDACPEGSGYASRLLRVRLSVREKETSRLTERRLIVKCCTEGDVMRAEAEKAGVFRVEALALGGVMSEVHRALAAAEGAAFRPVAARCFHCGDRPADFLVLEDLAAEGFQMAQAGQPLDYEHCAAVLRAYARLHAASARVLRDREDLRERLGTDPLSIVRDYVQLLARNTFRAVADQLRACADYSQYADRYLKASGDTVDRVLEARGSRDVQLLVMLHGDCWRNNVMFKYDAGRVVDLRLVDFQLSTSGSPAVDVQHLLFGSASEEVHRRHLQELLSLYHATLQTTLRAIGLAAEADAYPLHTFLQEMDRAAPVGLLFSTFNVLFLSANALGAEINKFLNDNNYSGQLFAKAYENPYSLSYVKYLTPLFEKRGLL